MALVCWEQYNAPPAPAELPLVDDHLRKHLKALKLPDNVSRDWSIIAHGIIEALCAKNGLPTISGYMKACASANELFLSTDKVVMAHYLWNNLQTLLELFVDCVYQIASGNYQSPGCNQGLIDEDVVLSYKSRYDRVRIFTSRAFRLFERDVIHKEDEWHFSIVHNATDLSAGRLAPLTGLDELFDRVWQETFPDPEVE